MHSFPTTLCQMLLKEADMFGPRLFNHPDKYWEASAAFQRTALVASFETSVRLFTSMVRQELRLTTKEMEVLRTIYNITKEEVMGIISDKVLRIINEKNPDANLRAVQALTQIMRTGMSDSESDVGRMLERLVK